MQPDLLFSILKDGGPYGLLAIALFSIRALFLRLDAVQEARIEDGRVNATSLQAATKALEKANELIISQGLQLRTAAEVGSAKIERLVEAAMRPRE